MGNHLIKMVFSSHSPALSNIIGVALFFSSFICLSKAEKSLPRNGDVVCTFDGYSTVFRDEFRAFVDTHRHDDVIECLGSCPCTAERIEAYIKYLEKDGMQDADRAIKRKRSISNIQFAKNMLDEHNKYRWFHGVPPLKLDNKLNDYAQNLAESNAAAGRMAHTPPEFQKFGENLSYGMGLLPDGKKIVQRWYSEISLYPGYYTSDSGHFSQVIWKNSKRLGVGLAKKGNEYFAAAVYDPPGNIISRGEFEANVLV